tara:strand:+ start:3545 stop:3772 length:228 start_codon:yes stop_codon:yes gene_type:complete
MNLDDEFNLEHLLFKQRKCRSCGETKDLLTDYYLIRKDRGKYPSSYSYECKQCTKKRIINTRKNGRTAEWEYPDW